MREIRSLGSDSTVPYRTLDIRQDDVDARDFRFVPSLAPLPGRVGPRPGSARFILDQKTEGACVGFALATVINTSLLRRIERERIPAPEGDAPRSDRGARENGGGEEREEPPRGPVSPRMLYEMARRYDDWPGESYEGTTLRAAMKGWHHHGVCSERKWGYRAGEPGRLTPRRTHDARRRPLGAYCRIADDDVSHLQAAVVEADAVLASAWVHQGWESRRLLRDERKGGIARIRPESRAIGLHAFAIVGYCPEGFIIQNSWGESWGSRGLAILSYEDWMENRQDAWVGRPGPETRDYLGSPKIFMDGFMGAPPIHETTRVGTTGVEGLEIDPIALGYLVNTGDRGALSEDGRLHTPEEDLPSMAARARLARTASDGWRDLVLYAHGGLNSELAGAKRAGQLWSFCRNLSLTAWFFVWETGIGESLLGFLRSRDDASGPTAGRTLGGLWSELERQAEALGDKLQAQLGAGLAQLVRLGWKEMHGRATGAAKLRARGGAALFAAELFKTIAEGGPGERYRFHLVGHSAGAIYLARLYEQFLRGAIKGLQGRVALGSINFMAPALSVSAARKIFAPEGRLPVPPERFCIWTLSPKDEADDEIGIYPGSLLTYVADHLERADGREPILGIRKDFEAAANSLGVPRHRPAVQSSRHGQFDDPGHEVETIFTEIAEGVLQRAANPFARKPGERPCGKAGRIEGRL